MDYALAGRLVELAAGRRQQFGGLVLVAGLDRLPESADRRVKRDFTDLLRSLRRSLVLMRFSCDLMLATRVFLRKSRPDLGKCLMARLAGSDCSGYQRDRHSPKVRAAGLPKRGM